MGREISRLDFSAETRNAFSSCLDIVPSRFVSKTVFQEVKSLEIVSIEVFLQKKFSVLSRLVLSRLDLVSSHIISVSTHLAETVHFEICTFLVPKSSKKRSKVKMTKLIAI